MKSNLRVHIVPVGFELERITEPVIQERADRVYLITYSRDDEGIRYIKWVLETLHSHKGIEIQKIASDIWNLFDMLNVFKDVFRKETIDGSHIYVNVSTGSKVASIAGTLACMIWKGTPYYAHIDYDEKIDNNGLRHQDVKHITEIPVYSINTPKTESLVILKLLDEVNGKLKKKMLIEKLENEGLINSELKIEAKHSKLKVLLNPLIGSDNPLVMVEYKGRQSNVILTDQGRSTLRIFGVPSLRN